MIQVSKILSELYGVGKSVVGFRQPTNPNYDILTGANLESSSGIYLESGIVTIENIKNTQEYVDISDADFNTQLGNFIKDSIIDLCKLVFSNEDKLQSGLLFNYENVVTNTITNGTDFVGYEIKVTKKEDITNLVNSLIGEFDSSGSVTVYLFHSSQQTAVENQAITLTEKNSVEQSVNWFLDKHKEFGGKYYIGYLQNGLSPQALNREWDSANVQKCFNHISLTPFKVSNWTSASLFDVNDVDYTSDTYGLNFRLSAFKDNTEYIINNKNRFAQGIKYQFQSNILKMILASNQSNNIEVGVRNNARIELDGIMTETGNTYSQGILRKLEQEAKNIYNDFIKKPQLIISTLQ